MKKLIIGLAIGLACLFGSNAVAADYATPQPVDGYTYLKTTYDPEGGALVSIDMNGDNECDMVVVFILLGEPGAKMLVPRNELRGACPAYDRIVERALENFKKMGLMSMIYDNDRSKLVPVGTIDLP